MCSSIEHRHHMGNFFFHYSSLFLPPYFHIFYVVLIYSCRLRLNYVIRLSAMMGRRRHARMVQLSKCPVDARNAIQLHLHI